jgi:RecA-family ATPase
MADRDYPSDYDQSPTAERERQEREERAPGRPNGAEWTAEPWEPIGAWDKTPPKPQEWTVHKLIPRRQVTLFSGEGGAGKGIIGLQLSAAHVLGKEWMHALPEPGAAMVFEAEDEKNQVGIRLGRIAEHYGATFEDLERGGLHYMSLAGKDALLAVERRGIITPTKLYDYILNQASVIKPQTIVFASLANVYAGSEIDRGQVTQFVGLMTRLAIAANGSVILISHPSLTGMANDSGISGNTAWHNTVRSRIYLRGVKGDGSEEAGGVRELQWKKNQYGEMPPSITLRWRNGLFLPDPIKAASSFERAAHEAAVDHVFETLLKRFDGEGRNLSDNVKATTNYAPAVFAEQDEAKLAKATRKDLERAMDRLFKGGAIKVVPYGPPSKGWKKIAIISG